MLEELQHIDETLLLLANSFHTPGLDAFMHCATGRFVWIPFYLLLGAIVVRKYGWRRALLAIVMIGVTITLADQLCSSVLRPLLCRPRPSNPDSPIAHLVTIVDGYRGGRYGFPSCHAANSVALAVFFGRLMRSRLALVLMLVWALFLCYTRMYLGVHYPGDILLGGTIGCLIALLTSTLYRYMEIRRLSLRKLTIAVATRVIGIARSVSYFLFF